MNTSPDLGSARAKKARFGKKISELGYKILLGLGVVFTAAGIALLISGYGSLQFFLYAAALTCFIFAIWYRQDLSKLPPAGQDLTSRLSADVLARLNPGQAKTPQAIWQDLRGHWQAIFFVNRLLLPSNLIADNLSSADSDAAAVWQTAIQLADAGGNRAIEPGHITAALLQTSPQIQATLTHMKLSNADVTAILSWLERGLDSMRAEKPYFGGIGRDWANGFTPLLERFGYNISLGIEKHGSHYGWLTESKGVQAIKNAFSQGAKAVALIGDTGAGKTSHIYALSQLLLEEKNDRNLEHRQVVALNPSVIISSARGSGDLEHILLKLLGETAHAGHIILFLDDAHLFFKNGTGSFDATQVLLQALQSGAIQIVMAMTPRDYQILKTDNSAFAGLLTPVVLAEPPESDVMHVLEDTALNFESKHKVMIAYEALREAYRLSGRYEQEIAYPGKAIQLLEQSLPHAEQGGIVSAVSVQQAIEQTRGVKVGASAPAEASQLLNLEDQIHQRMINQTRAVQVVASALRRARAGVANPKRPIGSFLFLGPTGVGKTELAKSIAATYFNDESNMIRLDMSEFQQPDDVQRLLSAGQNETSSLILAVRSAPFSVVLLDEIEKAHPNILNLLLQLLDEGQLTDTSGRAASFKDCIIIATSNAGANEIRGRIEKGEALENFEQQFTDNLINSGQFKPELLNRFDEIVLFRPLNQQELAQVVTLMVGEINKTLANQNITVELTPAAVAKVVAAGYDARLGARPMRRTLQRAVEDTVANQILSGQIQPGTRVTLDEPDLQL